MSAQATTPVPPPEPIRVLLVEDDPGDALLFQQMLSHSPSIAFRLERVGELAEGLRRMARGEIDIVILDLSLPDSRGFETFAKVRATVPDLPIIVLTGLDDEALAVRTVHEGAQDYLVKGQVDGLLLVRSMRYAIERRRAETVLAEERSRLRGLIDALPDHIYVKDRATRFVLVNQAVAAFFGLASPEQVAGKTDRDFFSPGLAAQFEAEDRTVLGLGQEQVNREAAVRDAGGEVRWVLTTKVPLRDSRQEIVGLVGINRDITARKRAQEQLETLNAVLTRSKQELTLALAHLQQSHEELKAAQARLIQMAKMESVGRLAAGVAHEVKNPLAIMLMAADYLEGTPPAEDATTRAVLGDLRDAIQRAAAIIQGLLEFSAASQLEQQAEDLNQVLTRALLLVRHELQKRHIGVEHHVTGPIPPLQMDRSKIEQVFINLFMNSIQAMPNGGRLTVRSSVGPAAVAAVIEDTGSGIPTDQLSKIFDPFFTTKPGVGSGLGLAVAKSIIESHGGSLDLVNRPEGGVRATVTFATNRSNP